MADETNTNESAAENSTATTEAATTAATEGASTESSAPATDEGSVNLAATGEETKTEVKAEDEAQPNPLLGAPAEGEDYVISGLPEGMEVDNDAVAAVAPIAREIGLSNEGFSRLAGAYAEHILPRLAEQQKGDLEASIVATRAQWEADARDAIKGKNAAGEAVVLKNKAGEVLSFDGSDMKGVQSLAAKAMDRLAPEGFREFLDKTGLAVHPQMVAFAYAAGKAIAEDRDIETSSTTPKPLDRVAKYYPTS